MGRGKSGEVEFFTMASRMNGTTPATAKQWWNCFYETILRDLFVSGQCYLPKIGHFVLEERKGGIQKQKQKDGTYKYYEVPTIDKPVLYPEDEFVDDVNMMGVTKTYRRRVKKQMITARDREREQRARQFLGIDYEEAEIEERKQADISRENFDEFLVNFRNKFEEKQKSKEDKNNEEKS